MANLTTHYAGLTLKNPVIVSSSGLTNTLEKIQQLEEYGAGAVVLKSIFEEQINYEVGSLSASSDYPEAGDYLMSYVKSNAVDSYITLIEEATKKINIPVIASINCVSASEWIDFAVKFQEAGAAALEINVFYVPVDINATAETYEKNYLQIAEKLREKIKIPIIFKLGQYFTNPLNVANQLYYRKIDGVVLFNRFYAPDIDIEHMKITAAEVFSKPDDIRQTLRWVGLLASRFANLSLSASTGVHNSEAAIKLLLAGADTVQVCSALYKNGSTYLKDIIEGINTWMDKNAYASIDDIRGVLSYEKIPDPAVYERVQFMKYFSGMH